MPEKEVAVTFLPMGKTVYVLEETRLLEAAAVAGAMIDQPCGGEGTCGKCRILVSEGACEPTLVDDDTFSPKEIQQAVAIGLPGRGDRPLDRRNSGEFASGGPASDFGSYRKRRAGRG